MSGALISVTATGRPPLALTRYKGSVAERVNTMVPSAFHVPPRVLKGASATACTSPLATSIRFNWPREKNPTDRLSGDQKGLLPPSVPGSGRAASESSVRSHSWMVPFTVA